ncbi:unnamed protein product, partial [Oppiella nova]
MIMIKELVFLSLFITTIKSDANYQSIDCQSNRYLEPCRCHNDRQNGDKIETINCTSVSVDLKLLSQQLGDRLFKEPSKGYKIQRLEIQKTGITKIQSKVFDKIAFIEIAIIDNQKLDYIDKNAFNGSTDSLEVINIIDNRRLYSDPRMAEDLWKLIQKFVKLREIRVTGSAITSIPSHAFRSHDGHRNRLKHVDLSHNKIHTIGDYAFEDLSSPSLDLILSHNRIYTIGKHVFRFTPSKAVIRMIDLSHNQLTADSFDVDSFTKMGRSLATLSLKDNRIDTLHEPVFGALFDRSDRNYFILEVVGNQIRCDCPLQWTVKTKYCYTDKSVPVSHQIVSLKCGQRWEPITQYDFSYCPKMTDRLSPSCQRGYNSAVNTHPMIWFITIVYIIHTTRTAPSPSPTCPPAHIIFPCDCNSTSGQFDCGKTISSNLVLKQIFQESSRQTAHKHTLIFQRFLFQNSIVDQIESESLDSFGFREISIERNDYLVSIDEQAFKSTYNITDRVYFLGNPSIGVEKSKVMKFFNVLSQFRNASLIHAIDCGLEFIPDNAFRPLLGVQTRLQRLSFANNRIISVGNNPFIHLPNIRFLSLHDNRIDRLSNGSLRLNDSSYHVFIDLSKNQLNSTSFDSQALSAIKRPFDLQLADNMIAFLNETTFKSLFKRSITIKLWRNPVNCSDCRMKWTSNEKKCGDMNNTISYAQRIDFQCKLFKDMFRKCRNDTFAGDEQLIDNPLA